MNTSPPTGRLTVRPATLEDLEQAVPMFNACAQEMRGADEFSIEQYRTEWSDPAIDLERDTRVAVTDDGRLVGCTEVWNNAPYVNIWVWGRVHPEFRGQGIGTRLMIWAEQRAREAIARAPKGARVFMRAGTISTHQPTNALLLDLGFLVVRHHWTMARDLDVPPPAPTLPKGITVRTMAPGEEAAVYRAIQEAFKDHWGFVEQPFEEGFARWQHRALGGPNHDPSLWFLAMEGDEIVGISICNHKTEEYPDMGWVDTLGVLRPWRRHGLGLALLYHSFGELYRRGRRRVGLGVDAGSLTGATRLYERAGMRPILQFDTYEKELRPGIDITTQSIDS